MLWIAQLTVTSTYIDLVGPLILIALGMGTSFVPLTLLAVSGVQPHEAGLASALLNTMQQVGGALGLAVLATVAIDATNAKLHARCTRQRWRTTSLRRTGIQRRFSFRRSSPSSVF